MKLKESYHFYAALSMLCWSLAFVFTRLALVHFSPFTLGFLRYFIATCILAVLALRLKLRPPRRADWPWFLVSGASGFFLYIIFFNMGLSTLNSASGSVMISMSPVMIALLAWAIYRERLGLRQWLAVALEFCGVTILTMLDGVFHLNIGLLWMFIAVFLFSIYNLLQSRLAKSYGALSAAAYSIFAGTLMLGFFAPAAFTELGAAPPQQWLYLGILGVFPSAIAYVTWAQAFAKARQTASVSNYLFLSPFTATLMGFLIAGEKPTFSTLVGGAVIICGLAIFYSQSWQSYLCLPTHKHEEKSGGGG